MKPYGSRWSCFDSYCTVPLPRRRNIAASLSHFWAGAPKVTYNWRFSINSHSEPSGHSSCIAGVFLFLVLETSNSLTLLSSVSAFQQYKIRWWVSPPFGEMWGQISKFDPQFLRPQWGRGKILVSRNAESTAELKLQNWSCWSKKFRGWIREPKNSFSPETLHNDRLDTLVSGGEQKIGSCPSILAVWPP